MSIIENKYRINLKQVKTNGDISDKGLLMIFEDIACYHSDIIGCGFNDRSSTHSIWVILNWKVNVIRRARYGDTVTVKSWTHSPNKLFSFRDFEMYDESNNLLVIASSKWVLIDSNSFNVMHIPDQFNTNFYPEDTHVFEEADFPRIPEPSDMDKVYSFVVQRKDIDVNHHMNNLYYLIYALEALPEDVYNIDFRSIEIAYKYSAKLNDTVNCFYTFLNGSHYVIMKTTDNSKIYCIVRLS